MTNMMLGRLLVATAALALGACGGGGGGSGFDSTPMPTPTPSPTPTPTPTFSSPPIFAGITVNTDFTELGLYANGRGTAASALTRDGFSVRYDAATQSYFMDLPVTGDGRYVYNSQNSSFWNGWIEGQDPYVNVFKPSSTNPEIQLTYTSFGVAYGYYTESFGIFAFGIPTPSSAIPVTGTANYAAHVEGNTLNSFAHISGDATLQFNFGAGTLAGHFDPTHELNGVITDLGTYNFINTVFGVGSTTFSGSLSHSSIGTLGAFDGRFTGPAAQELMARWTAPYLLPGAQQPGEMFGVWVGKKQ